MLEKDIENLIAAHPDDVFPGEGFKLIDQQYTIEGKMIDILFEDKLNRKIIVEVKRGVLDRTASGQVAEYYGLLKSRDKDSFYEMILCANIIPKERQLFLHNIGIECKELGLTFITELARKYDYTFIDDRSSYEKPKSLVKACPKAILDEEDISVWIFQGNPQKYDILNALSDNKIGNNIHWLVKQYKGKIKKGHLGLIWMSGSDAGIYALVRIESNPELKNEYQPELKYWLETSKREAIRVELTVIKRLINKPILRKILLKTSGLDKLSIVKCPRGTNFPVTDREWKIISQYL